MENETNNTKLNNTRLRTRLYLASSAVLLAGIVSAVLIYAAAMNDSTGGSRYEVIGGFVYPAGGGYTKKYVHDLQLLGGDEGMLWDQFNRLFFGVWDRAALS